MPPFADVNLSTGAVTSSTTTLLLMRTNYFEKSFVESEKKICQNLVPFKAILALAILHHRHYYKSTFMRQPVPSPSAI